MPVADNNTESGRQLNRRVELRIIPNTNWFFVNSSFIGRVFRTFDRSALDLL